MALTPEVRSARPPAATARREWTLADSDGHILAVAAEVTRFFARRRADAGRTTDEALDSDRYLALLDSIDVLLAYPPLTPAAESPACVVLPAAVATAVTRTQRALREADAQPSGPERDEHLHEMRKAAKRLRYAAEEVLPVHGRKAGRLVTCRGVRPRP